MSLYIIQKFRSVNSRDIAINIGFAHSEHEANMIIDSLRAIERELSAAYHSIFQEPKEPHLRHLYQVSLKSKLTDEEEAQLGDEFSRQIEEAKKVFQKYKVEYTGHWESFDFRFDVLDMPECHINIEKAFESF